MQDKVQGYIGDNTYCEYADRYMVEQKFRSRMK